MPNLQDHYWSPSNGRAMRRYQALMPQGAPIDVDTFFNVVWDREQARPETARAMYDGPVTVLLGVHDALQPRGHEDDIRRRFPSAAILAAPCGHQPIFELPSHRWTPTDIYP